MHKLIINKLGPIQQCELDCTQFMTLTGFQASGKSTIAKAIYFFRTIKEDIAELASTQAFQPVPTDGMGDGYDAGCGVDLKKGLESYLKDKFGRIFGFPFDMSGEMGIEYYYTKTCFIKLSLKESAGYVSPKHIRIMFSADLEKFLQEKNNSLSGTPLEIKDELKIFKAELHKLFDDNCTVVYIPAGRSMTTLLSHQFSYIYATMDDTQKHSLDYCTKDYIERILRIKPEFSDGLQGLVAYYEDKTSLPAELIKQALCLIKKILRGSYRYNNGEEQIVLEDGKYVKINFSSSGQQECVWILNLLFYYLLRPNEILFIIEEPESHLFPESQKYITELIALVSNCKHSVVLTTHSPYVLGTLNNLLYAYSISEQGQEKADNIIPSSTWLNEKNFDSWFIKNGTIENCMDMEIHMIQNERIDEISKVINEEFDKLLELQNADEEGAAI